MSNNDIQREDTAVKEANTLKIPILALVDTNCDPREIDHVIPSNDDAIRAIKLMVGHMANAVLAGNDMRKDDSAPIATPEFTKEQEEMSDEDLLGASTIAKVEAAQAEETVVEETTKEVVEEATKEDAEETTQEVVEETPEEVVEETPEAVVEEATTETKEVS